MKFFLSVFIEWLIKLWMIGFGFEWSKSSLGWDNLNFPIIYKHATL
jgi:hypothetical protein